ncbi:MAG: hypothetical protein A3H43_02895 [Gammaproteobacteria bacterium RIFCSPLOWO2_02_FULL_42_9]|nr:MAG: hypothetical protein A3H43_02895 [Gammaproteobacteria bacterium RIFCSPLOWO2_02_FULL_42_9]
MTFFQLIPVYLLWHYTTAWVDIARLYSNFAWFLYHFFSIPILLRTFFSPWKRLHESRKGGEGGVLGAFLLNSVTRIAGAVIRLATITAGVFSLALLTVVFIAFLFAWLFIPLILLWLVITGITNLLG